MLRYWTTVFAFGVMFSVLSSCLLSWNRCLTKMRQRNLQISWIHAYVIVGLCISKMSCVLWCELKSMSHLAPVSCSFCELEVTVLCFCFVFNKDLSVSGNLKLAHLSLNDISWYIQTRLGRSSHPSPNPNPWWLPVLNKLPFCIGNISLFITIYLP